MTWVAERGRGAKVAEAAQALRFAARYRARPRDPRRVRYDWLYTRLNLLPRSVDLTAGPVMDVGANAGDWTAALLSLAPRARVVAFEPAPEMASALRQRFAGDGRVQVVDVAASDSEGQATFHVTAHSHNSSLRAPRDMNAEYGVTSGWEEVGAVTVRTAPLDSFLPTFGAPSLVKIDVQGAESLVLAGAPQTLAVAQAVLIEVNQQSHYEDDAAADDLDRRLRAAGYEPVGRSDPWLSTAGEPLWFDVCYVRRR